MKTNLSIIKWLALAVLAIFNLQPATAFAQGTTAFTYQGQLHDGGTNANGAYTMIFALYDAVTNGDQIGIGITNSPTLANGLFTVNLDFGASAFNGGGRWLDITVQSGSDSEELTPRVAIAPAPYALYALSAGNQTNTSSGGGTINTTSITLGGGGTSWDIGTDSSHALNFSYGDPLVTKLDTNGDLDVPNDIAAGGSISIGNSGWNINAGFASGPAGYSFNNALVFSANGTPCMAMTPMGVWSPVGLGATEVDTGEMNVRNPDTWDWVVHIGSSGEINLNSGGQINFNDGGSVSGDGQGGLIVNGKVSGPTIDDIYSVLDQLQGEIDNLSGLSSDSISAQAQVSKTQSLKDVQIQKLKAQIESTEKRLSALEASVKVSAHK
jgi:hypothetical protein